MLILASQSPRREEILKRVGIPFVARGVDVDERPLDNEDPSEHVRRLARDKARAAGSAEGDIVLAADTIVVLDGKILGKPTDAKDAVRMLQFLSGREHVVMTGICLLDGETSVVDVESTRVRFVRLSEQEIRDYVASGEPMDKAGAYAIQGLASKFIDRIEGCYSNVVGLPVALVYRHLNDLGASQEPK